MLKIFLTIVMLSMFASSSFAKKPRKPPGVIVGWRYVPAPVQATFQSHVDGGKVKEVQKETAANGAVFYSAEVKGTDGMWMKIYVTDTGTFMKTEPDNARNKRKHKPLFGG